MKNRKKISEQLRLDMEALESYSEDKNNLDKKGRYKVPPLHYSIRLFLDDATKYLLKEGVNPNKKDYAKGQTALHYACQGDAGCNKIIDLLLRNGANIEARDREYRTPLHLAAAAGHYELVELLVDRGANIEAKDRYNKTPLHLAVEAGHYEVVELLLKRGANIEGVGASGASLLHNAVWADRDDVVELLVKRGANTGAKDDFTRTPLTCARQSTRNTKHTASSRIVEFLQQNGEAGFGTMAEDIEEAPKSEVQSLSPAESVVGCKEVEELLEQNEGAGFGTVEKGVEKTPTGKAQNLSAEALEVLKHIYKPC